MFVQYLIVLKALTHITISTRLVPSMTFVSCKNNHCNCTIEYQTTQSVNGKFNRQVLYKNSMMGNVMLAREQTSLFGLNQSQPKVQLLYPQKVCLSKIRN